MGCYDPGTAGRSSARPVGRKRPRNSPGGDYVAMCCICGANYYRSQLERKKDGQLYCKDDRDGLIALEEADLLEAQTHILGRRYVQAILYPGRKR